MSGRYGAEHSIPEPNLTARQLISPVGETTSVVGELRDERCAADHPGTGSPSAATSATTGSTAGVLWAARSS